MVYTFEIQISCSCCIVARYFLKMHMYEFDLNYQIHHMDIQLSDEESNVSLPKVSFLNEQCFHQCFIKVHRTLVSVHFFFLIQGQLESRTVKFTTTTTTQPFRTVKFKITKVPMLSVSRKLHCFSVTVELQKYQHAQENRNPITYLI